MKIIDIGTRRTRTTDQADEYLEMAPHGDVAIALGILNYLRVNDAWDKEFVKKHCSFRGHGEKPTLKGDAISFEEWSERIAKFNRLLKIEHDLGPSGRYAGLAGFRQAVVPLKR